MGYRYGGRSKGTPNKATAELKAFLGDVFAEVYKRPEFKVKLIESIATLSIDTKLLATLLAYYAGRPAQAVDVTHGGTLTLAQLITGQVPDQDDAADDDAAAPDDDVRH